MFLNWIYFKEKSLNVLAVDLDKIKHKIMVFRFKWIYSRAG